MSTQEEIFDFLTQPDNISVALDIADYVEKLKNNLHQKFWSDFNPILNQRCIESDYATTWKYHPHPARSFRREWGKSYIRPASQQKKDTHQLQIAFGQGARVNDYRFYWGVRWVTNPVSVDHPGMTALKGELLNRKMTFVDDNNWPGWGWYKLGPYEPDFIMKMYREPGILVNEIVDDVWQMFTDLRPLLEQINEAVRQV